MRLKLYRQYTPWGTYGRIFTWESKRLVCCTVERPWLDNKPNVSCIPHGSYRLVYTKSPKFGMRFHLENKAIGVTLKAPGERTHIMLHAANVPSELEGCIAPVSYLCVMGREPGGAESTAALRRLETLLAADQENTITIFGDYPKHNDQW